jgi:hypothetical protein
MPFVIDNSATCIICNERSQLVGPLRIQHTSVETTHGTASLAYAGTIAIHLTMNEGRTLEYHIPHAIYDPNSPFNILGILFLGVYLAPRIPFLIKMMMGPTFVLWSLRLVLFGTTASIHEISLMMLVPCPC